MIPNSSIPKTMRAVVTTGHGDLDKLDYTTVPVPQPKPGEVLIRVSACGINNTDIWMREGRYGTEDDPNAIAASSREPGVFPRIQGIDVVGEIVDVGEGVSPERIGERVISDFVLYSDASPLGYDGTIGSKGSGGYAEYTTVPAGNAIAIKSGWTDVELATIPGAYGTAETMLTDGEVGKGDLVTVTGASGGVGSALVQLAHARGAKVVALASTRKLDQVRSLNPDTVVPTDGDLKAALRDALAGRRLDVALDVVAGNTVMPLLTALRPKGTYVVAGAIGGFMVSFDIRTVYIKRLRLLGSGMGTRAGFRRVIDAVEADRIRPLLARSFPLKDIREAHTFFKAKNFFGKLVVIPEHRP